MRHVAALLTLLALGCEDPEPIEVVVYSEGREIARITEPGVYALEHYVPCPACRPCPEERGLPGGDWWDGGVLLPGEEAP